MPQVEMSDLFPTPWGILESRRKDIERGSFGGFDRAMQEEMEAHFWSVKRVAEEMVASVSTARRWLAEFGSRFILHEGVQLHYREDVARCVDIRAEKAKKSKASSETA